MTSLQLFPWQENLAQWWANVQQQDRIPHAILFSGEKGSGKRHVADQICRALYAHDEQAQRLYLAGNHPDFFAVTLPEKRKEISVEQIRDLSKRVTLTSQFDGWRVVWIEPADKLSRSAANALLKILEEPPKQVLFVVIVDELQRMLPTIRSRCQQLKMQLPTQQQALTWLASQPQVAGLHPEELQDWLAMCQGSPLRVLDALAVGDEDDDALDMLGMAQQRQSLLEELINSQIDVVGLADAWLALDGGVELHLEWLQGFALDLLKCTHKLNTNFCQNRRASALLNRLAPFVAAADVLDYLGKVGHIKRGVRGNVNAELSLQAALLPWVHQLKMDCLNDSSLGNGLAAKSYALAG